MPRKPRPYTGPQDLRLTDAGLHVDGYPDSVRVVALRSKLGVRLANLRLHQSTLAACERAMQTLGRLGSDDLIAAEAIMIGILTSFFSCFGKNQAALSLSADRIFRGMPDARDCFDYWKALRDKHFVHNESDLTFLESGVVLGINGEVHDILSLKIDIGLSTDEHHRQLLYNLIEHTLRNVISEIDTLLPRVFDEARGMSAVERMALPPISFNAPKPEQAYKTRRRK